MCGGEGEGEGGETTTIHTAGCGIQTNLSPSLIAPHSDHSIDPIAFVNSNGTMSHVGNSVQVYSATQR